MNRALKILSEDVGELEAGDIVAAVYNDGVIVLNMEEERHLVTTVIMGEPLKYDMNLSGDE